MTLQQTDRIADYEGKINKIEALEEMPESWRREGVASYKAGLSEARRGLSLIGQMATAHSEIKTETSRPTERRQPTRPQEEHLYAVPGNGLTEEQVMARIGDMMGQGLSYGKISNQLHEQGVEMHKAVVRKRAIRYLPELARQKSSDSVLQPVLEILITNGRVTTEDLRLMEMDGRKIAYLAIMLDRWVNNHPSYDGHRLSKENQGSRTVYVALKE